MRHYSKAQLNAISRSYTEQRRKKQLKYITENGLLDDFKKSKYKTMTGYLKYKVKIEL